MNNLTIIKPNNIYNSNNLPIIKSEYDDKFKKRSMSPRQLYTIDLNNI